MSQSPDNAEPPTHDALQHLESRVTAHIDEINARLVLGDGRFSALTDRINQTERRADTAAARFDSRFTSIDRRLDHYDLRIGRLNSAITRMENEVTDEIQAAVQAVRRTTIIGFAVSSTIMAAVSLITLLVANR